MAEKGLCLECPGWFQDWYAAAGKAAGPEGRTARWGPPPARPVSAALEIATCEIIASIPG